MTRELRGILVGANAVALVALFGVAAMSRPAATAVSGAAQNLLDGPSRSYSGTQYTITDSMRTFSESVWITSAVAGQAFDRTEMMCHGGRAEITWHIGDLEPVVEHIGINLAIRMDGKVVAGILRGSTVDTWGDFPLDIPAVVDCPAGPHTVDLLVRNADGAWGFPYVVSLGKDPSPESMISRGFIIREVWTP